MFSGVRTEMTSSSTPPLFVGTGRVRMVKLLIFVLVPLIVLVVLVLGILGALGYLTRPSSEKELPLENRTICPEFHGYGGHRCEVEIDECQPNPCQHGGSCQDRLAGYDCSCLPGYSGQNCETNIDECATSPCLNGGSCIDRLAGHDCSCLPGYSGRNCETNIDECASSPCLNGGSCIDRLAGYECSCLPGYSGQNCETNIDECASSPCLNGGSCIDRLAGYECSCQPGYSGQNCETNIDECATSPCLNGGSCIDRLAGYECSCLPGYSGQNCETNIDECATSPCLNGGSCIDRLAGYECSCLPGYSGQNCETNIDECASSPCLNGGSCIDRLAGYDCSCLPGYSGQNCETNIDECASSPCLNGGSCIDRLAGYECSCQPGYSGQNCETNIDECASSPCLNGGSCIDRLAGYECSCLPGYSGQNCETNIDECATSPCLNGGSCIDRLAGYECSCLPGYSGQNCETNIDECASSPCLNGGSCIDRLAGYECSCQPGYSGQNCETNIDECASSPCLNGGSCIDRLAGYECSCLPGYSGQNCETNIDECATSPCLNGGSCIDRLAGYECSCLPGYSGQNCETNIDECASSPCLNGGSCIDRLAGYDCSCLPGYSGENCETNIDECSSSPCLNGGSCIDRLAGYDCSCLPGYSGQNCETNIDECSSSPCLNGGSCIDRLAGYDCSCLPGYSGHNCETNIDECSSSPCLNGGSCIDRLAGYDCSCLPGYSGQNCETNIDECASSPCLNGGSCIDRLAGYECSCLPGYSGHNCETNIDECSSSPCLNGGSCIDRLAGYDCSCLPGYSGQNCETNIDECSSSPCLNGGSCIDRLAGYDCSCLPGYSGQNCETNIDECATSPCLNGGSCIDLVDAYQCICEVPFTGQRCDVELNPCIPNMKTCEEIKCQWNISKKHSCLLKKDEFGYIIESDVDHKPDSKGWMMDIVPNNTNTPYGVSIQYATFDVTYINNRILRFQIYDRENKRNSFPVILLNRLTRKFKYYSYSKFPAEYDIDLINKHVGSAFEFYVKRRETNTTLFNTSVGGLILASQYLQISSYLASSKIYGLGGNNHSHLRHDLNFKSWPIFARNSDSTKGQKRIFGAHPFYTCLEDDGKSHGLLFYNSNAMEVTLMPAPAITFRTIGGTLDFFILVGDNPEHVMQLYTTVVGRPMLPPYFALGFHFDMGEFIDTEDCNENPLIQRINNTLHGNQMLMPREVLHTRINSKTWEKLKCIQQTRGDVEQPSSKRHNMLTIDSFAPFLTGYEEMKDAFVADPRQHIKPVKSLNETQPPWLKYPDFFSSGGQLWWEQKLQDIVRVTHASGIYLELNEPTFMTESIGWIEDCPESPYENPPYDPALSGKSSEVHRTMMFSMHANNLQVNSHGDDGFFNESFACTKVLEHEGHPLSFKTLCMASVHNGSLSHYDLHNLHGLMQSKVTRRICERLTGKKTLVISQSTYITSGAYVGTILGNINKWEDLRRSIIGVLESNLFGIPLVGVDICDFQNRTTDEFCKRSLQLAAYFPFYRSRYSPEHEVRGNNFLIDNLFNRSNAPELRRSRLLPHLYTLFFKAHETGSTVVRPLFHEFPTDKNTWDIDSQFMWGSNLIISPILQAGIKSLRMYLPNDTWYRLDFLRAVQEEKQVGKYIYIKKPREIPVHVRGGSIIPSLMYDRGFIKSPQIVLTIFPKDGQAKGELYVDGLNAGTLEGNFRYREKYQYSYFTYSNCSLSFRHEFEGYRNEESVVVSVISINNVQPFAYLYINNIAQKHFFRYKSDRKHLAILSPRLLVEIEDIKWTDKFGNCPK